MGSRRPCNGAWRSRPCGRLNDGVGVAGGGPGARQPQRHDEDAAEYQQASSQHCSHDRYHAPVRPHPHRPQGRILRVPEGDGQRAGRRTGEGGQSVTAVPSVNAVHPQR